MDIAAELVRRLGLVADGEASIDDLYGWLAENVQTIADAGDEAAKVLADQAWIAVAEWQDAVRSDSEVRAALQQLLLRSQTVRASWDASGAQIAAGVATGGVARGQIHYSDPFSLAAPRAGGRLAAAGAS